MEARPDEPRRWKNGWKEQVRERARFARRGAGGSGGAGAAVVSGGVGCDLGVADTLYFHKAITVEYQVAETKAGLADFLASVEAVRAYGHEKSGSCCRAWGVVGDPDLSGGFDILDLIWMIDNKFKGGGGVLWPDPGNGFECTAMMDFDGSGLFDILDIIWGIDFKFKESGMPPICPQ